MTLKDFCVHFETIHICNFTPDIDEDGKTDGLGEYIFLIVQNRKMLGPRETIGIIQLQKNLYLRTIDLKVQHILYLKTPNTLN